MKLPIRRIYVIAGAALLLVLAAVLFLVCGGSDDTVTVTAPDTAEESAALYENAKAAVRALSHISYQITTNTKITVQNETFTKQADRHLTITDPGTANMRTAMEELLTVGTHSTEIREYYSDGQLYATVNGAHFTSRVSAQEASGRYAPFALLDAALYADIQAQVIEDVITVSFAAPHNAEGWALPHEAQLISAAGQARISPEGQLLGCEYTVTYSYGGASFTQTTVTIIDAVPSAMTAHDPDIRYTQLDDPDAPRLLEEACGYLTQAKAVSADATDSIASDAFGIYRTQDATLHLCDTDAGLLAQRQTAVALVNNSRGSEPTQTLQTERFENGTYSLVSNGNVSPSQEQISQEQMRTYCRELLISTVLLPEYIVGMTVSEAEHTYRLEFSASEELALLICENACNILYEDPQLLNQLASSYETVHMTAYLEIDRYTGIPAASGMYYGGIHTIQETVYELTYSSEQTYSFSRDQAYHSIMASAE